MRHASLRLRGRYCHLLQDQGYGTGRQRGGRAGGQLHADTPGRATLVPGHSCRPEEG